MDRSFPLHIAPQVACCWAHCSCRIQFVFSTCAEDCSPVCVCVCVWMLWNIVGPQISWLQDRSRGNYPNHLPCKQPTNNLAIYNRCTLYSIPLYAHTQSGTKASHSRARAVATIRLKRHTHTHTHRDRQTDKARWYLFFLSLYPPPPPPPN